MGRRESNQGSQREKGKDLSSRDEKDKQQNICDFLKYKINYFDIVEIWN